MWLVDRLTADANTPQITNQHIEIMNANAVPIALAMKSTGLEIEVWLDNVTNMQHVKCAREVN